jgi:AsmA protein
MRRPACIIAIVAAVLLLGALALPYLVNANQFHTAIESDLTKMLGRQVKIGDLKLGLLSGTITASDLSIADDPAFGQTPFLHTKALRLTIDLWQAIFSHKLNIGGATIDKPDTVLIQVPSGMWNFSSLGAGSPGAASGQLTLSMKSLKIDGARLSLTQGGATQTLDDVSIEVKDFAPGAAFPFSVSAKIAGGGDVSLAGKAGPIDPANTANTPLTANFKITNMTLPEIGGVVSADGTAGSNGQTLQVKARGTAEKLKFDAALTEDFKQHTGQMSQGDIAFGAVKASLTGTWTQKGDTPILNMTLAASAVPISGLMELLPAPGATLEGGTASAKLTVSGPTSAVVVSGPVSARNTRLKGFDLGAKMSPIEKLAGIKAGPNTEVETFTANVRIAHDGTSIRDIHAVLPTVGEFTGGGTISPSHALDFRMKATIHPGILVSVLTPSNIPFTIEGTSSDPQFRPQVGQLAEAEITRGFQGLFGGKKKK